MKYIKKDTEPEYYKKWRIRAQQRNASFSSLRSRPKNTLKEAILKEQGYICCYCESEIDKDNSHLEHIRPQSFYPHLIFEYNNIICSCGKDFKIGDPIHCGNKKCDWYDENNFISPLDLDCENHFIYTEDGYIHPNDQNDQAAIVTIEKLELNHPNLVFRRKTLIDFFNDTKNIVTEDQMNELVSKYLSKTADAKYNEFFTLIKCIFCQY